MENIQLRVKYLNNDDEITKIQALWRGRRTRKNLHISYVTEIVDIKKLNLDIPKLTECVSKYMDGKKDYILARGCSLTIGENSIEEYWIEKCSKRKEYIGGGSCPIDVLTDEDVGIDSFCVTMNKNESNEKSLMQKFRECGTMLDNLWAEKKYTEAINGYLDCFKKKIKTALQKYKISDFYYIAFISTKDSVYLTALKMNIDNFNKLIVDDDKKIDKSIFIKNFINPSYGNVKLYKSKKRLELRFKKNILDKSTLLYHISS